MQRIIWQDESKGVIEFERQFVEDVLLSKFKSLDIIYDGTFTVPANNSIIIFSQKKKKILQKHLNYFKTARNFILVHLSGENLYDVSPIYEHAKAVFRSYYDPRIRSDNVFAIPLGFKTGFLSGVSNAYDHGERNLIWFFAGQIKSHRQQMLTAFQDLHPHHIHIIERWLGHDALPIHTMKSFYEDSIFAPCPFGNINPDSFRIMEALECGCIPVSLRFYKADYFRYIFGNHPFPLADTWYDLASYIEFYTQNKVSLMEKQKTVQNWYEDFKERLATDVENIVNGQTSDLLSEQFQYQKEGQQNLYLRFKFDFHFRILQKLIKLMR